MRACSPAPREIAALLRAGGINAAVVPTKEYAITPGTGDQAELMPVGTQYGIFLDKRRFLHIQEAGRKADIVLIQVNETAPPAAIAALDAFRVSFRHGRVTEPVRLPRPNPV